MRTSVGEPTTLYIKALGNPPPEITWIKNGSPVNDPLLQNGSLYIHSTTPSDQGTYTVTATSDEGSTSETIKLVVLNPQYMPCELHELTFVACVVLNCLCACDNYVVSNVFICCSYFVQANFSGEVC